MQLSLDDIYFNCPINHWMMERRHSIVIPLVEGGAYVIRGTLRDFRNVEVLKKAMVESPVIKTKTKEVQDALVSLLGARLLQFAVDQLKISNGVSSVLKNIDSPDPFDKVTLKKILLEVGLILQEYDPYASRAGWGEWLIMCQDYINSHKN